MNKFYKWFIHKPNRAYDNLNYYRGQLGPVLRFLLFLVIVVPIAFIPEAHLSAKIFILLFVIAYRMTYLFPRISK